MKRFDRVKANDSFYDQSSHIVVEEGTTGTVLGIIRDDRYDGDFAVLLKLDEPIYSDRLGLISVQDVSITVLEVIDGDS